MYCTCKLISVLDWFIYPSVRVGIDLPQFVYEFARSWDIIIHVRVYGTMIQWRAYFIPPGHPWNPSFIAVQLCC
jgi:hypothetical protein